MKLGMQHQELQPIIVCPNHDPGLTLTYLTAKSNLLTNFLTQAFPLKKVKTEDFSETIAASDLKISRIRHLIDNIKICEY